MKSQYDSLVVGGGETGAAIAEVLSKKYRVWVVDRDLSKCVLHKDAPMNPIDVLHICIPPGKHFERVVRDYQKEFKPTYTVIHSSVPVGTSRKLNAFHSPIRGIHPNLAEGILVFVKYLAPRNPILAGYFQEVGITVRQLEKPETTEALKLWDTTVYGLNIVLEKEMHRWCEENGVDFDFVYTDSAITYNLGYERLKKPQYKKYILKHVPGTIGGHCVTANIELFKSPICDFIKKQNATYVNKGDKVSGVQPTPRKSRRGTRRGTRA